MFRPDSDFFDSGDSSYHQDPLPQYLPLSPQHRRQQQLGSYRGFSLPLGPPMSARQNKKQRKGRNNANNRERTVTTLTEDPNTPYLIPTPSEEPAGAHMSSPFNAANTGKLHTMSMGQPYQMPGNFGFGYGAFGSPMNPNMHQQHHPAQQQQQPFFQQPQPQAQQHQHNQLSPAQHQLQNQQQQMKPPLPPGKNDLEVLQNLKKLIIDNQHPFFRAVPQPAALASLYKGPLISQSQPQGRRLEQGASEYRSDSGDGHTGAIPSSASGLESSAPDNGRRQPRTQGKDRRPNPPPTSAGGHQQQAQGNRYNNAPHGNLISNLNLASLKINKNPPGSPSAGLQTEPRSSDLPTPSTGFSAGSNANEDISDAQRSRYDYSARSRVQKSDSAAMGDRPSHGNSAYDSANPGSTDDPMDGKGSMYGGKDDLSRPGSWGSRHSVPYSDTGAPLDAERNTTPRPQNQGASANVDARPLGGVDRGAGPPPGDAYERDNRDRARGWEWQHERDRRPNTRRPSAAADQQRPYEAQSGQPPVQRGTDESPVPKDAGPPSDARPQSDSMGSREQRPTHVPEIVPPGDNRPPVDFRSAQSDARALSSRPGPDTDDVHSSRASSVRPADNNPPGSLGSGLVPPVASGGGDNLIGGPVDDPASMRPSLKDRMNPPSRQSRTPSEVATPASGEHPPPPPLSSIPTHHGKKNKFNKDRGGGGGGGYKGPPYDAPPRSGDRSGYGKSITPGGGGGAARAFHPRSPSLDGRAKMPPSPPGPRGRDFRGPNRDVSRDRPGGYRPEYDPRQAEPGRYPPYRDFSPPPPSHGDRGRPGAYPPSPPPPPSGGRGPAGGEPRAGPGDWGYQYPPASARPDWSAAEEAAYYKRWPDAPPPPERERYDREYPPRSAGWDARSDRDYVGREPYPPGPPIDDRYPPSPRDADRGRPPPAGYAAPYNRVRPRSPSPLRRSGPPPIDDPRPPMKRPREDYAEYYPPPPSGGGRDAGRRPPPADYLPGPPPRTGSPGLPPSSSASSWPPPPSSAASAGPPPGGGPPGDRDYRMSYAPAGYDRPRSPGPPGGRASYNRGGYGRGEPRDRGGYGMPRP